MQIYRPDAPFPVYSCPYWWSDNWNPLDYGREYDFSLPFFPQFLKLRNSVPQPALSVNSTTLENCDYINAASYCKDCYLVFSAAHNRDCYFCDSVWRCTDCIDCTSIFDCELCYDGVFLEDCYALRHSFNCKNCHDAAFLWNCVGCQDCFGCANLRQARFYWFNQKLSEEDYRNKVSQVPWDDYAEIEKLRGEFLEFARSEPQPAVRGVQFGSSTGDFLNNSENALNCFDSRELRECANCLGVNSSSDCMDQVFFGENCELIYNSTRCGYNSSQIKFSTVAFLNSANIEYSLMCMSCHDCFGCIGLRNCEFCILNRQYRKDEYLELRRRIIAQMSDAKFNGGQPVYGEFFPYAFSLHPLNDTEVMFRLPLSKAEALHRGAIWDEKAPAIQTPTISWDQVPAQSADVPDNITGEVLACAETGQAFRITAQELKAYKRLQLPLPRKHWRTRLLQRRSLINPPILHRQRCEQSGQELYSTFPPEDTWHVLSNEAYTQHCSG